MSIQEAFPAMGKAALENAARGWHVFPAPPGSRKSYKSAKHSDGRNWGATTDADEIRRDWTQWPKANLGIVAGPQSGLFVIDADTMEGHGKDGVGTLRGWIKEHGDLPHTIEADTPSGGWHVYFRYPDNMKIQTNSDKLAPGIDVRGEGGMVLAPPSVKTDGTGYSWRNPPGFFELADCPQWLLEKIEVAQRPKLSERAAPIMLNTMTPAGLEELADLLDYIDPDAGGYDDWCNVLMGIHDHTDGGGDGFALAEQWSARGVKYKPGEVASKWQGFTSGGGVGIGTIAILARQNGADLSAIARQHKKGQPIEIALKAADAATTPPNAQKPRDYDELMEAAQALEPGQIDDMETIVIEAAGLNPMRRDAIHREIKGATKVPLRTLRDQTSYGSGTADPDHLDLARVTLNGIGRQNIICADAFVWQWSDAGVWAQQDDRAIKQAAQNVIDTEGVDVTASRVNGVIDVLKSEIFKPSHVFNRGNPETVNCLNGELELDDFVGWHLEPHCREHFRTTQIPVAYDAGADAPLFRAFLDQVFQDDPDKADKIKSTLELMGFTLMSHARHERFVMLIGPGANGKSVLLALLEGLLGPENVAGVQPSNFENRFQRAHLHQKLANIVTELKQGEVIADAELKAITSGEAATVEHKFQNPFVMRPFATCWFGTNHMPHTRDFSEALFRRATILQFNRTFAPHEQDPLLKEKLLTELPGILNIVLDAYANASAEGFTQPESSDAAKKEWRLEADQVAQFVDDCCERLEGARAPVADVYRAYEHWANENGIGKTMSQKGMRDRLNRLGFGADRDRKTRYVTGLKVTTVSWGA